MKLLLDTHIWIWSQLEPHRIGSEVARELTDPKNDLFLSAVSIWEAISLIEKRRLRLDPDFGVWFQRSKEFMNLMELAITWEVAHELRFTMLSHRDPADRFLVATAKVYDLTLVTADERLTQISGLKVLANS